MAYTKVTITLPDELVARLDEIITTNYTNRSAYIRQLIVEDIKEYDSIELQAQEV